MFSLKDRFYKKLDYERLADLLPYDAWDPETGIYFLSFGEKLRFGWFFVCNPVISPRISHDIETLMGTLPPESTLQISLIAMPYIGDVLSQFLRLRNKSRISKHSNLTGERKTLLRHMLTEKVRLYARIARGFKNISFPYLGKNISVYISFTIPSDEMKEAVVLREKTRATLQTAGFYPRKGTPYDLYDLLVFLLTNDSRMLRPSKRLATRRFLSGKSSIPDLADCFVPLRELITPASLALRIERDRLISDDSRTLISISYKHYPSDATLSLMNELVGSPERADTQLSMNFYHCFNAFIPDQTQIKDRLSHRHTVAAWQAFGPIAKFVPKMGKLKDELALLLDKAREQTVCEGYLHTLIISDEQDADEAASQYISHAKRLNFHPVRDRFVLLPLLINSLPMSLYPEEIQKLFRKRTLTSEMVSVLAPVQADGGRFGDSVLLFGTRRGFVFSADIFASPTAYNGMIFGGTGQGKSFFMNEIITSYFSCGGKIIVIDVGRSYEKLCSLLGGEHIQFGEKSPININPFLQLSVDDKESLAEEMEMLKNFMELMCAPKEGFSDYQKAALTDIFNQAVEKYGRETTFDRIAEILSTHPDQRVKDISVMLKPWLKGGENYRWVASGKPINFENDLIVIEMEELSSRPILRSIVLYYLIYRISHDFLEKSMKDPEFRKKPKFLFIDEAWEQIRAGNVEFIERGYRRFRKTGSGIWIISQAPTDLEGTPIADAVWANSQFVVSLYLEKIDKNLAGKRLSSFAMKVIPTLKTFAGKFSEIYIKSPFGEEVLRFYAPRYTQLIYSTKADEVARIEQYKRKGMSLSDAIFAVMEEESSGDQKAVQEG